MAFWKQPRYSNQQQNFKLGDGINTGLPAFDIKDSEASHLLNIGSDNWPAMSVRPGRAISSTATSTTPNALGQRTNSEIHALYGNTWQYTSPGSSTWTVLSTALASTDSEFLEFARSTDTTTISSTAVQRYVFLVNPLYRLFFANDAIGVSSELFTTNQTDVEASTDGFHGVGNSMERTTNYAHTGVASARVGGVVSPGIEATISTGTVTPGYLYRFNLYTMCASAGIQGQLIASWLSTGSTTISSASRVFALTTDWAAQELLAVAPDGANYATLALYGLQTAGAYVYWDTASFKGLGLRGIGSGSPDTRLYTVHKNRMYGALGAVLYFSALGNFNDWTTANDAGQIVIANAKGDATAITTFNDHIIVWTEHSMHELWGTGPPNYSLTDIELNKGCISHRSVCECDGRLYWMAHDGVREYKGASSRLVSGKMQTYIDNINKTYMSKITAGSIDEYLYIAIPHGTSATTNNLLLVYDTDKELWFVESGNFVEFTNIGESLYAVDKDGTIWKMRTGTDDGGTPISWEIVTKAFKDGSLRGRKTLSDLYMAVNRSTGSTSFGVGYSTNVENNDSTSFTAIANSINASSNVTFDRVQLPATQLQNVNTYRLRLAGTGPATVHEIEKHFRVKAR
jgi:hypothetical protein